MIPEIQFIKSGANFTIIVPGDCNANCGFCFWNPIKSIPKKLWRKELDAALEKLHDQKLLTQISISGGEPTCSPLLSECLQAIRTFKIQKGIPLKVVLNTNGSHVLENLHHIEGVVNHVNISRHDCDDNENFNIFQTTEVPTKNQLANICVTLENAGIDVTLNCVVSENFDDLSEVQDFVDLCKKVGAVRMAFRKDIRGGSLTPLPVEEKLGIRKEHSTCPVCSTSEYRVKGFPVTIKVGFDEPVTVTDGYAHELIFHPNGKVCLDWAGNLDLIHSVPFREAVVGVDGRVMPVDVEEVVTLLQSHTSKAATTGRSPSSYGGCGGGGCGYSPISYSSGCGSRGCGG